MVAHELIEQMTATDKTIFFMVLFRFNQVLKSEIKVLLSGIRDTSPNKNADLCNYPPPKVSPNTTAIG